MSTFDCTGINPMSLFDIKRGDVFIDRTGEKYIALSACKYDEHDDMYYFEARTEKRIFEDFCGFEYVLVLQDGTCGGVDDVCYWNEMTGAI